LKKALVVAMVMVLGLGVLAFAGPLSGSWSSSITFDPDPTLIVKSFSSVVQVDYIAGGWTFGSTAIFNLDAFDNLYFSAEGVLGAFSFKSMLDFEPQTPSFNSWINAGSVSIAGLNLYGVFMVDNVGTADIPLIGTGMLLGGSGSAGDVTITAQAQFNMVDYAYYFWAYGYDWAISKFAYESCGTWYKPGFPFYVQTESCTLSWSGLDIYVDIPFTCFTAMAYVSFSCTNGFEGFGAEIYDIDLGLGWVTLSEIDIDFTVTSKAVSTFFGLTLGDVLCFTPYLSLDGIGTEIQGITLNALLLSYSFNGVTFKAGEIFDNVWASSLGGAPHTYGFTSSGTLSYTADCIYNSAYDEYFAVEIDGDSCCGGGFGVSIFNWFDTGDSSQIFDWMETTASLEIGLGSNTTFSTGLSLDGGGLNTLTLRFEFTW